MLINCYSLFPYVPLDTKGNTTKALLSLRLNSYTFSILQFKTNFVSFLEVYVKYTSILEV